MFTKLKNTWVFKNLFFIVAIGFSAYQFLPPFIANQKLTDQPAKTFQYLDLSSQSLPMNFDQKVILVFWATWCGPCKIELGKLNQLILDKKISSDKVLAISIGEDAATVQAAVKNENYLFQVGLDVDGQIAGLYGVRGTPTIVFVNQKKEIEWITSGLSPSLSFRAERF